VEIIILRFFLFNNIFERTPGIISLKAQSVVKESKWLISKNKIKITS